MWTPSALKSEAKPASDDIWRVVEHQHMSSTLKIVDTHAEQETLEEILEEGKPRYPAGSESLHYLLKTPFRYFPPNPNGSRFRRANDPSGVFYGSMSVRTALAEMAYYRTRFFLAAPSSVLPVQTHKMTAFLVGYSCRLTLDLTSKPFHRDRDKWIDPGDYSETQKLGDQARKAGICAIFYESVRDSLQGINVALLSPVFSQSTIKLEEAWYLDIKKKEVCAVKTDSQSNSNKEMFIFSR